MGDDLLTRPVFMLIVIAFTGLIVKSIIDYFTKRQLIAKGTIPDELDLKNSKSNKWTLIKNLKWAMICLGFGLAVIVSDRIPALDTTAGSFGIMFIGAGLGYLIYFLIAWNWLKKEKQDKE